MINLMYVVLMAMLALNISTEVLDGFSIVEESLNRTTANSSKENLAMMADLDEQMKNNPAKVSEWVEKAKGVKEMSDSLYNMAQQLKEAIVKEADGADGKLSDIRNKEDLDAPAVVMLLTAEPILLLAPPGTIHEASSGTNLISMAPTNNPTTYIQVLPMPCIPKPPISPQV